MAQEAASKQGRTGARAPVALPRGRCITLGGHRRPWRHARVQRHCGRLPQGLGTVMRHDLWLAASLPVPASSPRMREAPGAAALVALTGQALRLAPRRPRALASAVPLAAVAAATHQHLGAAACTGKRPGAVLRVALPSNSHAWLAAKASTRAARYSWPPHGRPPLGGAILRAHSRSNTSGAWRLATTCRSSCRRARPVKAPVLPRLHRTRARCEPATHCPTPAKGAGAQPQYKPSSIESASGSDLRASTRQLAGSDLARLDVGGCAPSMPSPLAPPLGQFR